MKKYKIALKQLSAAILSLVFLFGSIVFFELEVSANTQSAVTDFQIEDLTSGKTGYNLKFNWSKPSISQLPSNATQHDITGYNIKYRDATQSGSSYITLTSGPLANNLTTWNYQFNSLESGRIFSFINEPFHFHDVVQGGQVVGNDMVVPSAATNLDALFLSDIVITATGEDNLITAVWDIPKYNGKELFTDYKIYYSLGGSSVSSGNFTDVIQVSTGNVNLKKIENGTKYSFTFASSGLSFGIPYAIKVEPLFNKIEFRRGSQGEALHSYRITVDGKQLWLNFTDREYRNNELYIKMSIDWEEVNASSIRIFWPSLQPLPAPPNMDIYKVELKSSGTSDFTSSTDVQTLLTISDNSTARAINSFTTQKPAKTTYYKLFISYTENGIEKKMETMWCVYNPSITKYAPTKPEILNAYPTDSTPLKLQIVWDRFMRVPYTTEELQSLELGKTQIADKEIVYDVWITNDLLNFSDSQFEPFKTTIKAGDLEEVLFNSKLSYTNAFSNYFALEGGAYVSKTIQPNKVYYIRMQAIRTQTDQKSDYSYYSVFIPPIEVISNPAIIGTPPLKVKTATLTSITIEWEPIWFEMIDPSNAAADTWHHKVGVTSSGQLLFGDDIAGGSPLHVLDLLGSDPKIGIKGPEGIANIKKILSDWGVTNVGLLTFRFMDLSTAKYDLHTIEFETLAKEGSYENYLAAMTDDSWEQNISVKQNGLKLEYTVAMDTAGNKLVEDTSYVIMLRPYFTVDGVKKPAYHPSHVLGTTLISHIDPNIIPTVPSLTPESSTDLSITVSWKYVFDLQYELAYSEKLSDYKENGKIISNSEIVKVTPVLNADGITYTMTYEITNLFPETQYHIWIRAKSVSGSKTNYSEWSNPVNLTTKEIVTPLAPVGLGLASNSHVDEYNKENDTEYLPFDIEYIIVEWFKDVGDLLSDSEASGTASTSAEQLLSPLVTDTVMLKFNELIANRSYYFRVKTRLTVTKTANGIQTYYQYIIQMGKDEKFIDYIEVIIPSALSDLDEVYTKSKDSPWSSTVKLLTGKYKGEYDGDVSPDQYPLPDKDFEIIYTPATNTLELRYLSDKISANGTHDNFADQRFISELIASKTHELKINMAQYNGKEVTNRTLTLPYSIVKALEDRKITLSLQTATSSYKFSPGFYNTAAAKNAKLSGSSELQIKINNTTSGLPALDAGVESYVSPPQKMSVLFNTAKQTVSLKYTNTPTKVSLNPTSRSVLLDKNVGAYSFNETTKKWAINTSAYDKSTNTLVFSTTSVSAVSAIARTVPASTKGESENNIYTVATKLNFKDLTHFDPSAAVPAQYINKIVAAIANNKLEVNVKDTLSDAEYNSLDKAGLIIFGGDVSREQGIYALVRLYELKTKSAVKGYSTDSVSDAASASKQAYRDALYKAAEIGFLSGSAANPSAKLTMNDMIHMLNIIIEDSGM